MKAYTYILECADGSYYTGSTKDLDRRLKEHQNGEGANHTKKHLPVELVYFEEFNRIDEAFYREKQIQGWTKAKKEALINNNTDKLHDLAKCKNDSAFDFAQAPETDFAQAPETDFAQAPASDFAQAPETDFAQAPASDFAQAPASDSDQVPESSECTLSTVPESSECTLSTVPESSECTLSTVPESSECTLSTVPESSECTLSTVPESNECTLSTVPERSRRDVETKMNGASTPLSHLVPKLRFKEFKGDWSLTKVLDFAPLQRGFDLPVIEIKEGPYPVVFSNGILKTHSEFKAKAPGVVTGRSGTIGKVTFVENDYWPHNTSLWVTDFKGNDPKYVFYFYLNFKLERFGTGSGVPTLNRNDVHSEKRSIPSLPEQQKIATFLSAVDEKIQQLSKKKELLEQYKKGVMQQLFSQKIRFKPDTSLRLRSGGVLSASNETEVAERSRSYPDWEWVGGNKLFDNISDKKHNSDLPILAITQDQGAIPRDMIDYKMTVTEKSIASYKVVQVGDFVISLRTFQGGIEYSDYHGICSPAYIILRPSSDDVDREFYKFYLKTSFYIKQLQKNLEGIRDGKMISYKYFSEINLPFPSRSEQQKIASYLSSIDSKIESVASARSATEQFKKGLLQQMFV